MEKWLDGNVTTCIILQLLIIDLKIILHMHKNAYERLLSEESN